MMRLRSRTLLKLAMTMAITSPLALAEWPTYHGDYGLNGVSDAKFSKRPARLWKLKTGKGLASPIVASGKRMFCITYDEAVMAIDLEGKKIWSRTFAKKNNAYPTPQKHRFIAPPFLAGRSLLIVVTMDGTVFGLSPRTGKTIWTYIIGEKVQGSPTYIPGKEGKSGLVIVIAQEHGNIHAIRAATGESEWMTDKTAQTDGHLSISDGRMVIANCDSGFLSIDARTGKNLGFAWLGVEREMASGVAISKGQAFAGNRSGALAALDIKTNKIQWYTRFSEEQLFIVPAVTDKLVVASCGDGVVRCVDREKGKSKWSYKTDAMHLQPAVIAGDLVLVSADGDLLAIGLKDGKLKWKMAIGDEITPPAIVNNMIVVGSDDGFVMAFGAGDKN